MGAVAFLIRPVVPAQAGTQGRRGLIFPGGSPGAGYFPGGRPGAGYLLLRGQKKLTEEKAAPVSRACASPVLLDEPGGCGTRSK